MVSQAGTEYKVREHIIVKNFWEYYVLSRDKDDKNLMYCYVLGFENEFGYVDYAEIKPYIISETRDLTELMPAPNYKWKEVA
jgi:hypothetical protein